jgi:predicted nucleic acid-binding protein
MKVVSNSGPLINLAKVGQFALLQGLFQHITIPPAVFEEVVVRGGGQPGAGETNAAQWITREMLAQSDVADILAAELDRGEAEAIALALLEKADWLLIDERVGRRFAQRVGLKVKGTLGVLLEGVRRDFIDDLQPLLDTLVAKGTWIAPAIYAEVLKLSQEIQRSRGGRRRSG